jgi:hypothetical protein
MVLFLSSLTARYKTLHSVGMERRREVTLNGSEKPSCLKLVLFENFKESYYLG